MIYLEKEVPGDIAGQWKSVAAAEWRISAHYAAGTIYPPTQHMDVVPPRGMCSPHHKTWIKWRNHAYDRTKGTPWPGGVTSYSIFTNGSLSDTLEVRRVDWDRKTLDMLASLEELCFSRRNCGT